TLLLLPMGLVDNFDAVRYAFIIVNSLAIILALALLTRLVGESLRGPVWPVAIDIGFSTESVINTLTFSNINGIFLLLLSVFLFFFGRAYSPDVNTEDSSGRSPSHHALRYIAGTAIGLAI